MEKFREIGSFNDPLSYDYWNEYYLRLLNYIDYYKKSVELLPDSEFYWAEYIQFLLDVGLSKDAITQWNRSPFSRIRTSSQD